MSRCASASTCWCAAPPSAATCARRRRTATPPRRSGVDIRRTHLLVFGIAAACAGIGGVLVGTTFSFTPTAGLTYLLTGFAVVVLGGLGSVRGTLVGAIGLGVVESVGGAFFGDGYRDIIGFAVFLVVLVVSGRRASSGGRCSHEGAVRILPIVGRRRRCSLVLATGGEWARRLLVLVGFQMFQLAALAQAWSLLAGYGGVVSLATSAFVGTGAVRRGEGQRRRGLRLVFPRSWSLGVVAALLALIVSVPMFRFRGLYFTIASLVLATGLGDLRRQQRRARRQPRHRPDRRRRPTPTRSTASRFAVLVLTTLGVWWIGGHRLGLGLRAIRDDEDVAAAHGRAGLPDQAHRVRLRRVRDGRRRRHPGCRGSATSNRAARSPSTGRSTRSTPRSSAGPARCWGPLIGAAVAVVIAGAPVGLHATAPGDHRRHPDPRHPARAGRALGHARRRLRRGAARVGRDVAGPGRATADTCSDRASRRPDTSQRPTVSVQGRQDLRRRPGRRRCLVRDRARERCSASSAPTAPARAR